MPDNSGTTLGDVLDSARNDAGYSLRQLAAVTAMPMSRLYRLLNNEVASPAPASLMQLAGALDLSLARLFKLAGHPYPSVEDLLTTDHGLPEDAVADVIRMIDRLATRRGAPDAPTA